MGGKYHPKLNIGTSPIANKYREGKMKSTLKRELNSTCNHCITSTWILLFRRISVPTVFGAQSGRSRCVLTERPGALNSPLIANATKGIATYPVFERLLGALPGLSLFRILFSGTLHFLDVYLGCLTECACADVGNTCALRYRAPAALVSKGFK